MRAFLATILLRASLAATIAAGGFGLSSSAASAQSVTTTSVTSSLNPSAGESVTFSAQVTAFGDGAPTGTVSFLDGSDVIGAVTVKNVGAGQPIVAGFRHNCALTASGGVKCWGLNNVGQLGDDSLSNRSTPVDVVDLDGTAVALAAGLTHTCAVMSDGSVKCWGSYGRGLFDTPRIVDGLSGVTAITIGTAHTCVLINTGGVKCWGRNLYGQLGDGTTDDTSDPVDVSGLTDVASIAAGHDYSCAVTRAGSAKCWGDNTFGQLGNGTTNSSSVPVDVSGLSSGVIKIAGGGLHACALTDDNFVRCWGSNSSGQLGDGSTNRSLVPVSGFFLGSVAALSVGNSTTCAIQADGVASCWGDGASGQLAEGRNIGRTTPVPVTEPSSGVVAVTVGLNHSCFVTNTGAAHCAGLNTNGQLGNGTTTASNLTVPVTGLTTLLHGSASISLVPTPGSHGITARYDGDDNHDASTSDPLTQTVNVVPGISSADSYSVMLASSANFTVQATGYPVPALNVTGTLPPGVTFTDNGDGTGKFEGTTTATGTYGLTISAANGAGSDAQQSFSLIVTQAPSITSASQTQTQVGLGFEFNITASGYPAPSISLEGALPDLFSFSPGTGTASISWLPLDGTLGTHTVTIKADNGVGVATQSFEIVVDRSSFVTWA